MLLQYTILYKMYSCYGSGPCSSPKLSTTSFQEVRPRGSLESDNVYITEHLLQTFSGVAGSPAFFFRSFQAGFSVNLREPSNSVCGCNGTSEDILEFMSSNNIGCPVDQQTVGAVFPDQERKMEATVWYNNQVSLYYRIAGIFHREKFSPILPLASVGKNFIHNFFLMY